MPAILTARLSAGSLPTEAAEHGIAVAPKQYVGGIDASVDGTEVVEVRKRRGDRRSDPRDHLERGGVDGGEIFTGHPP